MMGLGCVPPEQPDDTRVAVEAALEAGYRLIDTASVYENEAEVGRAINGSSIPRQDIFLTTKVWNSDQGYDRTLAAFDRSLELLGLEYIDLYLLHWPLIRLRKESWRALEQLVTDGRCRAIGVSNYAVRHLQELLSSSSSVPVVNQVEYNPFLHQRQLQEWCRTHNIQLMTHTPMPHRPRRRAKPLLEMASRYGRTPAQMMIRWALQKDVAVLTRASTPEEIRSNGQVFDFEIGLKDLDILDGLHQNLRVGWDPTKSP